MAKSHYTYHDVDVEFIGAVTTVDGEVSLTDRAYRKLSDLINTVNENYEAVVREVPIVQFVSDDPGSFEEVGYVSRANYRAKGYSKCDKDDTYNWKKGMIVASRKAELKATKRALKDITYLSKSVTELAAMVKEMEDRLDQKVVKLSVDLETNKQ